MIITASFAITTIFSQKIKSYPPDSCGAKIEFDNIRHDFGVVLYNGDAFHKYVFTNTGSVPLIIKECLKGCGCTSVDWTKEAILPGKKGFVKATFNTQIVGHFNKGVDVYTNTLTPRVNLRLIGTVEKLPGITPENAIKANVEKTTQKQSW